MTRVSLSRLPGDRVLVVDGDAEREVAVADLPAYVESARGRRAALGVGRHRAVVPAAAGGRGAGRALPRPAAGPPPAAAGARGGRAAAGGGAVGALGPARAERAVRSGAVLDRRHGRAPARRPRGRSAAGRGGGIDRGRPARAAARGGVVGCPRRGRDDVRRRAVAGRRPRAPAHRPARAAAAARRPAARARGAGRRGARRVRRTGSQPRLAARAAGGAAPGRAGRHGHPRVVPARARAPGHRRRCCATSSSRTCSRPTAGPGSTSG